MLHEVEARLRANAIVASSSLAAGFRPDPRMLVSEWAERYRIVPDIGSMPGPWRNEVAPYLVEPMDRLSPDDPCEGVVIMKPAQSGGSAVAENWLGFIMHMAPGPAMYIGPTVRAAKDWKVEKLDPTIEATPVLSPSHNGVVAPQRSRSGEGSTADRLKFRGAFLLFAGANSAATLRQHSIRYMVRDDRSGWTDDADGEGDPKVLSDKRLKTYRVFGMSKVLDISTPLFKGADIHRDFENGDRRRWYGACKACGNLTDFDWDMIERNDAPPYRCRVACPSCGEVHTDTDRETMFDPARGACWIPTAPDADGVVPPRTIPLAEAGTWRDRDTGRYAPSYAITGFMSVFERWETIAREEDEAGDDPELLRPFVTTTLGWPYEPKGEGPDWEVLSARRDPELVRGELPVGALYITLAVDVQGDGLYWERIGWGPGKQSWLIDYGYLSGETDVALEGAWSKLDRIVENGTRFAGRRLADDLIGVDAGYNSEPVYEWVRRRPNALALKGEDGWSKLPIFKAQTPDVKKRGRSAGKAKRFGIKVWLVGTWGIKGALMVYLGREIAQGEAGAPTGYCRFPRDTEEEYFRQLVSEYVRQVEEKGETVRRWEKRGPNHWLDCRVYNFALTHHAGLWAWDEKRWDRRAADLAELTRGAAGDLFDNAPLAVPSAGPTPGDDDGSEPVPAGAAAPARPIESRDDGLDALASLNR